jgi:NADH dehydrogenase (ubiquinone) flavoprotein 2
MALRLFASQLAAAHKPAVLSASFKVARSVSTSTHKYEGQLSAHRASESNTSDAPFDFTEANYKQVRKILAKYPENYKASAIIPLLDLAQRQVGNFLPLAAMDKVASILDVPTVAVYETASFYTMFNREKVGKYFIQLCGTTPCMVCGSEEIKKTITDKLGIGNGETTADGRFTLLEVECLGACANAPMIQVNDDFYECLTPETTLEVLESCEADKPLPMKKWGSRPMNGQLSSEGPQGKTSLHTIPSPPPCRDLEPKVDPKTVKESMFY